MIEHAKLDTADFSGRRFERLTVVGSSLRGCSFEGTRMDQVCFGGGTELSEYVDCRFDRSKITAVSPGRARFVRCSFRDCVLREFFAMEVELVDCVFSGKIQHSVSYGTVPETDSSGLGGTRNEFHGNDFHEVEFDDVDFRGGIDLRRQRLPQADHYLVVPRAAEALARIRQSVIEWKDLELRRKVIALLKRSEFVVQGGQRELFIDRRSVPANMRDASDWFFEALREQSAS